MASLRDRPALWLASVSTAYASVYWLSNRLTGLRSDVGRAVFDWEHAIPFVAWSIVPYLSLCGFFVASFFVGRDRRELARHVTRLLLALAISVACYAAFPLRVAFERPATAGVPGLLFDLLYAFDEPYNRAPSLHIGIGMIVWAHLARHLRGSAWRPALHAWFACVAVSVMTTHQHHVIDVVAGFMVGALCIAVARADRGRSRRSAAWHPGRAPGRRRAFGLSIRPCSNSSSMRAAEQAAAGRRRWPALRRAAR